MSYSPSAQVVMRFPLYLWQIWRFEPRALEISLIPNLVVLPDCVAPRPAPPRLFFRAETPLSATSVRGL